MLKFCIVEDNSKALNRLSSLLESIFMKNDLDAEVCFTTTNADELLSFVSKNKVDVIIFDIELDTKRRGLEIAEEIREKDKNCYFIFITGHLEYGFVAFQCKTFDYLPKPISGKRLEQTIMRLFDDINGSNKKFIKLDNKKIKALGFKINYSLKNGIDIVLSKYKA